MSIYICRSMSKPFDTLILFLKEFVKVDFEKSQQRTTKHGQLPSIQRVKESSLKIQYGRTHQKSSIHENIRHPLLKATFECSFLSYDGQNEGYSNQLGVHLTVCHSVRPELILE